MSQQKITFSTELMVNFKQAQALSPQQKFQALQTDEGSSLLFSIGTDQVFYLTQQTTATASGWQQDDLSSRLSSAHGGKKVVAKTFAVAQNFISRKIDVVLAITVEGADYLYVSLNNSSAFHAVNTLTIDWHLMPFDDPFQAGALVDIQNLYISQTNRDEYIVADISRSTLRPASDFLERYYIDAQKISGRHWNNLPMGGDLNPGVCSALGYKNGDSVAGIYTLGTINGSSELLYAPLYNPFDRKAPPTITRLQAPKGASALAVLQDQDKKTDLFVISDNTLYYYAAEKQQDGDPGIAILEHELFDGVKELFVFKDDDKYVLWGRNRALQVFYTCCLKERLGDSQYWTYPLPILSEVEQLSPLLNISDTSNEFFAVAGKELIKGVQSLETSIWAFQNISLPTAVDAAAERHSSYTTRIQLTDARGALQPHSRLYISANSRRNVYINSRYYTITTDPLPIHTDAAGTITLVEEIDDLSGMQIMVSDHAGATLLINPMQKPFEKLSSLNTAEKLKNAVITHADGSSRKLVGSDIDDGRLQQVAAANSSLAQAYKEVSNTFMRGRGPLVLHMHKGNKLYLEGVGDTIVSEVGDLFRWLASGVKHVAQLVHSATTGLWHFVVRIGDKVFQGVLDAVEKVVGAVRWLYAVIKTAVIDLLHYLEFLFQWKDITRTKDIFKNMNKLYLQHQIDQIEVCKKAFDGEMQKLVRILNDWGGITDWDGLGPAATSPADASVQHATWDSAPASLLLTHFQGNAAQMQTTAFQATLPADSHPLIERLFVVLKNEAHIFDAVLDQIDQLIASYQQLTLAQILQRLIAIIGSAVLETAQNVIDLLFDIISMLLTTALELLDTPIYIPVVSDILQYFGVPKLSMLDLISYMGALPVTVIYKIAKGVTPFADNAFSTFLIHANTFEELAKAFAAPAHSMSRVAPPQQQQQQQQQDSSLAIDADQAKIVYVGGNLFSGSMSLISIFLVPLEASLPSTANPYGTFTALLGLLGAGSSAISSTLVPKMPIKNTVVTGVGYATTALTILGKLIFSGPAQSTFAAPGSIMNKLAVNDGRATGAIVNSILILPALVCSCWHFYELAPQEKSRLRTLAIINETAVMTSYIARLSYTVAVNVKDPETKLASVLVLGTSIACTTGLQGASAIVEI